MKHMQRKSMAVFILAMATIAAFLFIFKNVESTAPPFDPIFTLETYPKTDCSVATKALSTAFMAKATGMAEVEKHIVTSQTHGAYVNLIDGKVDLILASAPSASNLAYATEKGVELELLPVVREALVFFTNAANPIDNLSLESLQKIYTGKLTSWQSLGGDNRPIVPYQRPAGTNSQNGMASLVMQGQPFMAAPKGQVIISEGEKMDIVGDYKNDLGAIGYSYAHYMPAMYPSMSSKPVSIDGIAPSVQNVMLERYPLQTPYYIVLRKGEPQEGNARRLADFMLSDVGQACAYTASYVPIMQMSIKDDSKEIPVKPTSHVPDPVLLTDTYVTNNLRFVDRQDDLLNYPQSLRYFKIEGLIDKAVEAKINTTIVDTIQQLQQSYPLTSVSVWVDGNFANVLSLELHYFYPQDGATPKANSEQHRILGLNFDLNTGDKIPFSKLFSDDVAAESALRATLYDYIHTSIKIATLIEGMPLEDRPPGHDIEKTNNIDPDEQLAYIYEQLPQEIDEINYSFTPQDFTIYDIEPLLHTNVVSLPFSSFAETLRIYDRYAGETYLFDTEPVVQENHLVFSKITTASPYGFQSKVSDNLYIDVAVFDSATLETTSESYMALQETIVKEIRESVETEINKAKANPDTGVFYNLAAFFYYKPDANQLGILYNGAYVSLEKSAYDTWFPNISHYSYRLYENGLGGTLSPNVLPEGGQEIDGYIKFDLTSGKRIPSP